MTQPWMNTYWTGGRGALYKADAREIPLPDKSVHCVVTSPPYWGLRDYGLGRWEGGDAECEHERRESEADKVYYDSVKQTIPGGWRQNKGEMPPLGVCHCGARQQAAGIGLEPTLGEWVESVMAVMREVKRVLRDDGSVWLNLGDAYDSGTSAKRKSSLNADVGGWQHAGQTGDERVNAGLGAKNLMGQPWRVALALQDDGWTLRSAIVWHKSNPMPESTRDRPTSAYEMIFLLAKASSPTFWTHRDGRGTRTSPPPDYQIVDGKRVNMWRSHDYFYDAEAIRETTTGNTHAKRKDGSNVIQKGSDPNNNRPGTWVDTYTGIPKRNARNVWQIPTQPRTDAHFATFPDELPRRCALAGTSEKGVCGECGAPWVRVVEKQRPPDSTRTASRVTDTLHINHFGNDDAPTGGGQKLQGWLNEHPNQTTGWQPTCGCNAAVLPAIVLDPFVGSGTTVAVAQSLGRCGIGLDLNTEYLDIAVKYITSGKYDWTPEDGSYEQTKETPEQRT